MIKISISQNFERAIPTCGSGTEAMAFYWHFQPSDDLPDPSGLLSASLSPVTILRLWEVWCVKVSKVHVTCGCEQGKFTFKQQVAIGSLHSNQVPLWNVLVHVILSHLWKNIKKKKRSKGAWHLEGTYENRNTKISYEGLMAIFPKKLHLPKYPTIW